MTPVIAPVEELQEPFCSADGPPSTVDYVNPNNSLEVWRILFYLTYSDKNFFPVLSSD